MDPDCEQNHQDTHLAAAKQNSNSAAGMTKRVGYKCKNKCDSEIISIIAQQWVFAALIRT